MFSIRDSRGSEFNLNLLRAESYPYESVTLRDLYIMLYAIDLGLVKPAKRAHDTQRYVIGKGKMREIGKEILRRIAQGAKDLTPRQKWNLRRNLWKANRQIVFS